MPLPLALLTLLPLTQQTQPTTSATAPQADPTVHLIDAEGTPRPIGRIDIQSAFLAPTSSYSEIIPRIEILDGTAEFKVPVGTEASFACKAIVHGTDQFMVMTAVAPKRFGPVLIENVHLPSSMSARGDDVTGILARRDGDVVTTRSSVKPHRGSELYVGVDLKLELSAGERLYLFPNAGMVPGLPVKMLLCDPSRGAVGSLPGDTRHVLAPGVPNGAGWLNFADIAKGVDVELWGLDAVLVGTPVRPDAPVALSQIQTGEPGVLQVELPAPLLSLDPNRTITLVLERPDHAQQTLPIASSIHDGWEPVPNTPLADTTRPAGLHFSHLEGPREQLDIRPTMGPGAAWGDLNHDGYLDLVVLQGAGRPECDPLPDRVWLGGKHGRYTDITASAGLASGDAGMGALLVDLNADTHLDLYCANYGQDRLFLGNGDGSFTDATAQLPKLELWSASVIAGDPDGDGDLDLYITSYLDYDESKMPPVDDLDRYQREDPIEMLPFAFPGARNVYLENQLAETGLLAFEDATEAAGLLDAGGRGMQAAFWDFDQDGDEDLYIANDVSPNVLFRNEGKGSFKDVSFATGLDDPRGGMGLAIGDVDGDGDEDMFLTNWQLEANALYENALISRRSRKRRRASFHDVTVRSGLGRDNIGKTSWGAALFDLELDGDLDLYVANGYTSPDYESTGICVGQTDFLFLGDKRGRFTPANDLAPMAMSISLASRGVMAGDHDRDGDMDLLVTANNGRLVLLSNQAKRKGTWLGIRLRWADSLNTYGIGARLELTASDGRVHHATLRAGEGYLTGNPPELHFGLGDAKEKATLRITWPDGQTTEHKVVPGGWRDIEREG